MKLSLTISLLFLWAFGFSQIKLRNLSLTLPDTNLLYQNISNRIEVKGVENLDKIKVTSTKSEVMEYEGDFIFNPKHLGIDTIQLFKGKTKIFENYFEVKEIDSPKVQIAGTFDTLISKERIIAAPFISVVMPNCFYKFFVYITAFEMTTSIKGRASMHFEMKQNKLSPEAIIEIKKMKSGDKIIFDGIRAIPNGGCPRKLNPKTILIQ